MVVIFTYDNLFLATTFTFIAITAQRCGMHYHVSRSPRYRQIGAVYTYHVLRSTFFWQCPFIAEHLFKKRYFVAPLDVHTSLSRAWLPSSLLCTTYIPVSLIRPCSFSLVSIRSPSCSTCLIFRRDCCHRLAKERARLKKHEKEGRMQPDPEIVKGLLGMFSDNVRFFFVPVWCLCLVLVFVMYV